MGKYTGILLVSDWDRTVTGPDRTIPRANTEAVLRFMEEGGRVTIATGQPRYSHATRWNQLPTNTPQIVYNGAEIYDYNAQKSLWQGAMPETARDVFAALLAEYPELHFEVQTPDAMYVFGQDQSLTEFFRKMGVDVRTAPLEEVPTPWLQFAVSGSPEPPKQDPSIDTFRYHNAEIDKTFSRIVSLVNEEWTGCTGSRSLPFLVETQARGCSKGETARKLLEMTGCTTLVCCGDGLNDLTLLRAADRAFVAGDGAPELFELGFERVAPSDQGVLADAISRL